MRKVYYAFSKIGGSGLFATRKIAKEEVIFRVRGKKIIKHRYTEKFSPTGPNWIAIDHERWLVPFDNNPWLYINHSCNPNSGMRGKISIVAMKPINKGEEVTIDYAVTEGDPFWYMVCHCGFKGCRNKIVSAVREPELFQKYRGYLPSFLEKGALRY